ncbi:hypothetical protein FEK35_09340 [Nocardia cyriacigeorgica]|uniref:Uncharacterized protein n=1 Tax=Nocardia cyriacigeorgica TaxID=135487 RepID=A0A5R8PGE9_9NOCA|nr:hypothetical protein [Nocardia cyriacigeorgica]TLG13967.1 hypothetical protein FEK35_09340 [Nocardia cyriacigeorgica]
MRIFQRRLVVALLFAGPLVAGVAAPALATAVPAPVASSVVSQSGLEGWASVHQKPKKVSVTVRCDKVKNGTPANGHSEEKIEGTGRAFNRKDAVKLAEQDVDKKMPVGYHKRHCKPIN